MQNTTSSNEGFPTRRQQLISDIGYAMYAPSPEKKAGRLWDWAVQKILEKRDLESQQLAPLVRGISGRIGLYKKGTKIRSKYYTEVLNPAHHGVSYAETAAQKSIYATELERTDKGKVLIKNYLGIPLNGQDYIFVLDQGGRLLTAKLRPGIIHHSTLSAGNPIFAAGEFEMDNGKIKSISNQSGHYFPRTSSLMIRYLLSEQFDLSNISLENLSEGPDYFNGNAWEYAKVSGKIAYQAYKDTMKDRNALESGLSGVLELNLPLLHQGSSIYPIHIAAKAPCSEEVLDFLLECGCDPNSMTSRGETPLGILCESETPDLVLIKKLLNAGADVNQLHGASFKSPLEIVQKKGGALVELLSRYDKKQDQGDRSAQNTQHQDLFHINFSKEEYSDFMSLKNSSGLLLDTGQEKIPFVYTEDSKLFAGISKLKEGRAMAEGHMITENGRIQLLSNEGSDNPDSFHLMMRSLISKVSLKDLENTTIEFYGIDGKLEFQGSLKDYVKKYGKENYDSLVKNLRDLEKGQSLENHELHLPVAYLNNKGGIVIDYPIHVAARELLDPIVFSSLQIDVNRLNNSGQTALGILCLKRKTSIEAINALIKVGANSRIRVTGKKSPYQVAQSVHKSNSKLLEILNNS